MMILEALGLLLLKGLVIALMLMVRKLHLCSHETQGIATGTLIAAEEGRETIQGLNQRLLELENAIKQKTFEAARLIEWLDKRDRELVEIQTRFSKHLNVEEREIALKERSDQIVKIGEQLRLIRK